MFDKRVFDSIDSNRGSSVSSIKGSDVVFMLRFGTPMFGSKFEGKLAFEPRPDETIVCSGLFERRDGLGARLGWVG